MIRQSAVFALLAAAATATLIAAPFANSETPPMPSEAPVVMPGDPQLDGSRVPLYSGVTFVMGRADKAGPLKKGEKIKAGAYQTMSLERKTVDGRDILVRSFSVKRAGDDQAVAHGEIRLDAKTLQPLGSRIVQGGQTMEFEYDWDAYVVRQTPAPAEGAEVSTDIILLEAGAHETWMAALPWKKGYTARIPAIMAGGGGKWWAVPRVVGSEKVDLGDGKSRDAWVIELDWWGMGKDHGQYTAGGGANDTAGPGGKYWVLKKPASGYPAVVRIQTEIDEQSDSVMQIQGGADG